MRRIAIASKTSAAGLAAALLLLLHGPALAQEATDPELEALIPDAAVANPADWARDTLQDEPEAPAETGEPDPESPLAELPNPLVEWPEATPDPPQLAPLEPEPEVQLAVPEREPAPALGAGGDHWAMSENVELVFPEELRLLPERNRIAIRYANLSTLLLLKGKPEDNLAQVAVRARADRQLLEQLLRIYGYYSGEVIQTVGGIEPGQDAAARAARVRFDLIPAARYRFGAVMLPGLEAAGADFDLLRDNYVIHPGDPVWSDSIVGERSRLDTALGENGYPFARLGEPDLLIDHAREEGDITQPVTPGGKYRIGEVISAEPDFLSGAHFESIARFDRGDLFRRSTAEDLRRAIIATGLVSSVTLTPRETAPPVGDQPGTVALDVGFNRAPLRTLAGEAGYDSGDGFRVEASWEHRNLFPPEGMLRVRGVLGTMEQLAGVTFRRNNFRGRDQILTLDFYADNVNRDAYAARTLALTGTFEKITTILYRKPLTWAVGFEALVSDEREARVVGGPTTRLTYSVIALPGRIAYDASDSLLDPSSGFRAALRASPEVSFQNGGTAAYARVQGDASYYMPVGSRIVLAARTRLGLIPGTALANIAPSRRLYAGGGGSVRGFGYQQIGPRDVLGDPSGGRSLVEFSLEARIGTGLFGGAVSLVPFVDAGSVDENVMPRFRDIRVGAGLGLRWDTGFGPIRVDVGTPLGRRQGESPIAVYVALGQAF